MTMSEKIGRWMNQPLFVGRQALLVTVTLGSVGAWLLFWFGE